MKPLKLAVGIDSTDSTNHPSKLSLPMIAAELPCPLRTNCSHRLRLERCIFGISQVCHAVHAITKCSNLSISPYGIICHYYLHNLNATIVARKIAHLLAISNEVSTLANARLYFNVFRFFLALPLKLQAATTMGL